MRDSGLAIAGFYDQHEEDEWGSDRVFARERYMEPVAMGRRTVTITGRPDGLPAVRRPARTIDERLAHRPERVASWTCAMGFLLILLAVLTAH